MEINKLSSIKGFSFLHLGAVVLSALMLAVCTNATAGYTLRVEDTADKASQAQALDAFGLPTQTITSGTKSFLCAGHFSDPVAPHLLRKKLSVRGVQCSVWQAPDDKLGGADLVGKSVDVLLREYETSVSASIAKMKVSERDLKAKDLIEYLAAYRARSSGYDKLRSADVSEGPEYLHAQSGSLSPSAVQTQVNQYIGIMDAPKATVEVRLMAAKSLADVYHYWNNKESGRQRAYVIYQALLRKLSATSDSALAQSLQAEIAGLVVEMVEHGIGDMPSARSYCQAVAKQAPPASRLRYVSELMAAQCLFKMRGGSHAAAAYDELQSLSTRLDKTEFVREALMCKLYIGHAARLKQDDAEALMIYSRITQSKISKPCEVFYFRGRPWDPASTAAEYAEVAAENLRSKTAAVAKERTREVTELMLAGKYHGAAESSDTVHSVQTTRQK